jgi:hypothetical protein
MAYIGNPVQQALTKVTSQSFNGTGSQTVFTLNRAVNTGEELEVFVENVQQEPGVGKSYTATGTTLTFDAAPQSGTGNIYVIYRGIAEVTRRLEHDPNAALAATTGTFSGAVSGTTGTFSNVGSGTSSPSSTHKLTLDHTSNYGGIQLRQSGTQIGQIIQEGGTGNVYIDADSAGTGGGLLLRTNGGTTRMTIDTSGRSTMPYQPSFHARGLPSKATTNGILLFSSTNHNIGNHYNTSTGLFTAPVSGRYLFTFNCLSQDTGAGYLYAGFSVNGGVGSIVQHYKTNSEDTGQSTGGSLVLDISANDVVGVYAWASSINIYSGSGYTWWSGYLLG